MNPPALAPTARRWGNLLLDALTNDDLVDLDRDVSIVTMHAHEATLSAGREMRYVHFPIDAVLSVIVTLGGRSIEVGTIGNESFVEGDVVLGVTRAMRSTICQVEGRVGRVALDVFVHRLRSVSFAQLMQRNVAASLYSTQQYLACNAKHSTLARCARWLLMTADRAGRAEFTLSRDFLGIMLSVRKSEMLEATGELSRLGAVTYLDAQVTILDAALLEELSCECYQACKTAYADALSA